MPQQALPLEPIPPAPSDESANTGEQKAVIKAYRQWRRLNTAIQTELAVEVFCDGSALTLATRLGIARTSAAARQMPLEALVPAFDLAIYGGGHAHCLLTAKPAPRGRRAVMLKAMAAATFSVFEVVGRHPVSGLWLRDLRDDTEVWLMDMGLGLSAPSGLVLATRLVKPAAFTMTTGLSIHVTDAVWAQVEMLWDGKRADIIRSDDRDRLAKTIFRAGVRARAVL